MMVEMKPIDRSGAIAEVGHDPQTNTLHVKFAKGSTVYTYPNITATDHADFLKADSMGSHLRDVIGPKSRGE